MASKVGPTFASALIGLFAVMSPVRRRQFYALIALMLVGALAEMATVASVLPFLALLADPDRMRDFQLVETALAAIGAESNWEMLVAAALLFIAVAILAAAVRLQLIWSTHHFIFGFGHDLAVEIDRRILSQPFIYHLQHDSTDLLTSLRKAELLVFDVLLQLIYCAIAILFSLFIIGALIAIDPRAALISILFIGTLYLLASRFFRARLRENSKTFERFLAQRIRITQESIGGIRDIIIDGSKREFVAEFATVDSRIGEAHVSNAIIGSAPRYIIEAASLMLVAFLALFLFREQGLGAAVPILGALALGAQRVLPLVQQIYNGWASAAGHWLVAVDVLEILRLPVSEDVEPAAEALPLKSRLELENVSFTYPGRKAPALTEISFSIPRGSKVAIVGNTGAGKTTLADLLMGMLEPTSGRILIDGQTLDPDSRRRWYRSIAHVPQSAFLASTTIARNIAFGSPSAPIDMGRVRAAARHAQLDDFVSQLPDDYDTPVGERGIGLSGGQRQRLAIARAFYKAAPVVVLDEATSALDDETEAAILGALDEMAKQGRTIIVIAHRATSIANCDLIVRLDGGRLAGVETRAAASAGAVSALRSR